MTQQQSGAERQRRYRQRHRQRLQQEAAAARERERQRALGPDAKCCCCGEDRLVFLATDDMCWNCQHAHRVWDCCPHTGISGVIG